MRPTISGSHPIANALVVVAGSIIIALSLVLGFFAFLLLGAVILTTAAIIAIRAWWLNRKLGSDPSRAAPSAERQRPETVIEGEYRVLGKDDEA